MSKDDYIYSNFTNGFVGACVIAYNEHYHLQIGPDEVWVTITSSLSRYFLDYQSSQYTFFFARYITTHAEKLRSVFVSHEGKMNLLAFERGNILSADYSSLIGQFSDLIEKNTKGREVE